MGPYDHIILLMTKYSHLPPGPRPNPPRNVTCRQQKNGLLISWLPPLNTTAAPVDHYVIHYRTVGRWVPLTAEIVGRTWYLWTTASRGAKYRFQVYSYGASNSPSEPSPAITFDTGGKYGDGLLCLIPFYFSQLCGLR